MLFVIILCFSKQCLFRCSISNARNSSRCDKDQNDEPTLWIRWKGITIPIYTELSCADGERLALAVYTILAALIIDDTRISVIFSLHGKGSAEIHIHCAFSLTFALCWTKIVPYIHLACLKPSVYASSSLILFFLVTILPVTHHCSFSEHG